ncbi:16637_t:CDS:2 [Dentiscutata heterogama]|uniref:16637_t:CDS:1 n=1 Tax=Dentiscutata heterogama TaxID=1316150 RepID=A0ACA9LSL2_9GLOM|nr:16637_t:CDS:2 [Dentiscutata heterogama]
MKFVLNDFSNRSYNFLNMVKVLSIHIECRLLPQHLGDTAIIDANFEREMLADSYYSLRVLPKGAFFKLFTSAEDYVKDYEMRYGSTDIKTDDDDWQNDEINDWHRLRECFDGKKTGTIVVLKSVRDLSIISEMKYNSRRFKETHVSQTSTKTFESEESLFPIFGITQDPKTFVYFIVMPYARKGNLRDNLQQISKLNWKARLEYLLTIINGIIRIHRSDLFHGNLHSGNILFYDDNKLLISDLGLSQVEMNIIAWLYYYYFYDEIKSINEGEFLKAILQFLNADELLKYKTETMSISIHHPEAYHTSRLISFSGLNDIFDAEYGFCPDCNQRNTFDNWCEPCNADRFRQNFSKWTSGNNYIDKFLHDSQLTFNWEERHEPSVYDDDGSCKGRIVAMKRLYNSSTIDNEFLKEAESTVIRQSFEIFTLSKAEKLTLSKN